MSRAESMNANKETYLETCKTNCRDMEEKLEAETIESCRLKTEVKHLQDTASLLKSQVRWQYRAVVILYIMNWCVDWMFCNILQVAELEEKNSTLQSEKLEIEGTFAESKATMEAKVSF